MDHKAGSFFSQLASLMNKHPRQYEHLYMGMSCYLSCVGNTIHFDMLKLIFCVRQTTFVTRKWCFNRPQNKKQDISHKPCRRRPTRTHCDLNTQCLRDAFLVPVSPPVRFEGVKIAFFLDGRFLTSFGRSLRFMCICICASIYVYV